MNTHPNERSGYARNRNAGESRVVPRIVSALADARPYIGWGRAFRVTGASRWARQCRPFQAAGDAAISHKSIYKRSVYQDA